jgi:hypothetical protein
MRASLALSAVLAAALAAAGPCRPAAAQFYEKVDLAQAAADALVDALDGGNPAIGSSVATLAALDDPQADALFRAMARSGNPAARVYGVLGAALASGKGIDPALYSGLADRDERAAVIRESNVTGILRKSPVGALLAEGDLPPAAVLSLVAEAGRRGEPWDAALLVPIAASDDPIAAGFASLLLRSGQAPASRDESAWTAFRPRLARMTPAERAPTLLGLVEATLLFELRSAVPMLLAEVARDGTPVEVRAAAVGMALRLDPARGVDAWRSDSTGDGSQRSLVRAAMQLLAAAGPGIAPEAFDDVRNGNPVLDAIANAGQAQCRGDDPVPTLVALLDSGHSGAAEWALIRAGELPPEKSAPVWRHLLKTMESAPAGEEPPAPVLTGLARELMRSDPDAVRKLIDRFASSPTLAVAIMSGVHESKVPQAQDIARERRGSLPRMGESIAVLTLARAGAPLTEADRTLLARAAAGGGDLQPGLALEAAWYYVKSQGKSADAAARLAGASAGTSSASEGR